MSTETILKCCEGCDNGAVVGYVKPDRDPEGKGFEDTRHHFCRKHMDMAIKAIQDSLAMNGMANEYGFHAFDVDGTEIDIAVHEDTNEPLAKHESKAPA